MAQNQDYADPQLDNKYQQDIEQIRENLVALMTAHSGNTEPSGLSAGALWLDTSNVPYTLKQLDSDGDWVDQALLTDHGRDVDNARGTRATLDKRISESLNDDGSLKTNVSANISQFIDFAESGTNVVDSNTFEVDGDHAEVFHPNNERGRIAKVEQPNQPTTVGPVNNSSYDSGTNTTTVNLIESKLTDTLNSGTGVDDIHYGTVDPSDQGGLPLIRNDKLESDPKVNYLDPDGLVISNNSTDSDHDIDVDGGAVWVNDDSGGSFQNDGSGGEVVELSDESPAFKIDTTGDNGLINSSSLSANTWYELGIIADSSGSNNPSVVGYTDGNRPTTSSDLPSGFDEFRAMGTPGKTWWVRTDGSSNILDFEHESNGFITWPTNTLTFFSSLVDASSNGGTFSTVDISAQSPPTKVNIELNQVRSKSDGSGAANLEVASDNGSVGIAGGQVSIVAPSDGEIATSYGGALKTVTNQQIFWVASNNNGNLSRFKLEKVKAFKAVD